MRALPAVMFAFLPLVQAQDSPLLRSVEPRYDKYSEDLATDFDAAIASVTITVLANGKPFALDRSSVPLPMAVVMALKEYEFRPQGRIPHGRPENEWSTYQVTLDVPIRQRKTPVPADAIRVNPGVALASRIKYVPPAYSEYARHNRIRVPVTLEVVIDEQGDVESLKIRSGPFALIEAAYDAVQQWQYKPTTVYGELVELLTDVHVFF